MVRPEQNSAAEQQQRQQAQEEEQQQQQHDQSEEPDLEAAAEADSEALLQEKDKEESIPMVEIKSSKEDAAAAEAAEVTTKQKSPSAAEEFVGLTKEQLEEFANDPFWRRVRLIVFVLFWLIWFAMLAAVIVIIVVSPKCPPRPQRSFWQAPFYRLQVRSFAIQASQNLNAKSIGSISGLQSRINYVKDDLGIDNFMIDSLIAGNNGGNQCVTDFTKIDSKVGTVQDLVSMAKRGRRKGFNFIMELDFTQAAASWANGNQQAFISDKSNYGKQLARDGKPAWADGVMHIPNSQCNTINISNADVVAKLKRAMQVWLDRGLSGFILNNVAYLAPAVTNSMEYLYSKDSVAFVNLMRKFIDEEAASRGRDLVLFVDAGNTGQQPSISQLSNYSSAHAVLQTQLGRILNKGSSSSSSASTQTMAKNIGDILKAAGPNKVTFMHANNWAYLARNGQATMTSLILSMPGVPIIYYGQELGMQHVAGVKFMNEMSTVSSYLSGNESTDQAQTPMQWYGPSASAGWLGDSTIQLDWIDLSKRGADIKLNNLHRLSSSGHPQSTLQVVQQFVKIIADYESMQWGGCELLRSDNDLLVIRREAERFPAVLIIVSNSNIGQTLTYPIVNVNGGRLLLLHTVNNAESSYEVGENYSFASLYVPPNSILVFVAKDD